MATHVRHIRHQLVNEATGELSTWVQEVPVTSRRGPDKRTKRGDFTLLHHDQLFRLHPLTGLELRVLLVMIEDMGFGDDFRYSTAEIAEAISSSRQSVAAAVRRLKHFGLVIELDHRSVIIDPRLAWRGETKDQEAWIKRLDADGLLVKSTLLGEAGQPAEALS
jgi:hypothetical protein